MIDERDLLKRIIASAEVEAAEAVGPGLFDTRDACRRIISILDRTLATQPDADAVPELPAHLIGPDERGDYWMTMPDGTRHRIRSVPGYEGYAARMAEAWAIIEARERARRAGS